MAPKDELESLWGSVLRTGTALTVIIGGILLIGLAGVLFYARLIPLDQALLFAGSVLVGVLAQLRQRLAVAKVDVKISAQPTIEQLKAELAKLTQPGCGPDPLKR